MVARTREPQNKMLTSYNLHKKKNWKKTLSAEIWNYGNIPTKTYNKLSLIHFMSISSGRHLIWLKIYKQYETVYFEIVY